MQHADRRVSRSFVRAAAGQPKRCSICSNPLSLTPMTTQPKVSSQVAHCQLSGFKVWSKFTFQRVTLTSCTCTMAGTCPPEHSSKKQQEQPRLQHGFRGYVIKTLEVLGRFFLPSSAVPQLQSPAHWPSKMKDGLRMPLQVAVTAPMAW